MKPVHQLIFWATALAGILFLVWLFKSMLLPFVLGGAIAYLLNPLVNRLVRFGAKRRVVVLGILGCFLTVLVALLAIILPILVREAAGFVDDVPQYAHKIWLLIEPRILWIQEKMGQQITADQIQDAMKENIGKALQVGKGVLGGLTTGGLAIVDFFTTILITPVVAYFLMKEWPRVTSYVKEMLPKEHEEVIVNLAGQIDGKISGFVRGQIIVCLCLGLVYAVALSVAGLNYGFLIGLGTGVLSIIPFVGSAVGLVTSLVVSYLQSGGDITFIGIIAAIFFVGQFIEGNFITPKLLGDSVGLHPLWIIFSLMAGGSLLGLLGMFLSIPVAASIGVIAGFMIEQYKASAYYRPQEVGAEK
ncbi:MAG: AI-2E family transporter [Alphaproteobacteria bacterium]|nr:AI-2E family transporter [Alphaproteobacteria bacterium]